MESNDLSERRQCACDENQHDEAEDGIELGEHGKHHGRTESIVPDTMAEIP